LPILRQPFIHLEQFCDALAFSHFGVESVRLHYSVVVCAVRFKQVGKKKNTLQIKIIDLLVFIKSLIFIYLLLDFASFAILFVMSNGSHNVVFNREKIDKHVQKKYNLDIQKRCF